ncbi:MAG: hypothetical protein JXR96_21595 [Deltaproteobacteria bacterium]|nr:hypothetical protein [Deltaproteobacteria bacterium]
MEDREYSLCACCGARLDGMPAYTLRVDLFADGGPIHTSEAEIVRDHGDEIRWLLSRLEHMDEVEVCEEESRVFERFTFSLCSRCRRDVHGALRDLATRTIDRACEESWH